MPNIGPMELIIVLVIALLILGPKRLPAAGRSLGRGITEFRAGIAGRDAEPAAAVEPPAAIEAEQTGVASGERRAGTPS